MTRNSWPSIQNNYGSGSGKTNILLNLINNEPDTDKIYLYARDPYEAKYQSLTNKRQRAGSKYLKWFKSFYQMFKWYEW